MKIVLFGGGLQVLSTARSLKESGYCVDVIGTNNEVSRKSRFVHKCTQVDIETLDINTFNLIIKENDYEVIIPMEDDYATWLSKNKDIVEKSTNAKCAIMDYDVYALASDKTQLMAFCK